MVFSPSQKVSIPDWAYIISIAWAMDPAPPRKVKPNLFLPWSVSSSAAL